MPVCAYCKSTIPWGEGLVEEGKWYEEKCYKQKQMKRRRELEDKAKTCQITMEEAVELKDINQFLINLDSPPQTKNIHGKKLLNYQQDIPINKIRFGKRTDIDEMLKSGEIRKSKELNPENGKPMFLLCEPSKPIMKGVFCPSPKNIIPYEELKLLEEENTKIISIKNKKHRKKQ